MPTVREYQLTSDQREALKGSGLSQEQIDALPNVRGLNLQQIKMASKLGVFPQDEKELTLEESANLPDSAIDYSESPEWTDEDWAQAVWYSPKPRKEQVTIRLDSDTLEYFRSSGPGYQSRINAVLRLWIKAHPTPPSHP